MKKSALALTLFLAAFLTSLLAGAQMSGLVDANPTMFGKQRYCDISIESPQNGTTLNTQPAFLNFTVTEVKMSEAYSYFYILDEQDIQSGVSVEDIQLVRQETVTNDTFFPYEKDTLRGGAVLPDLLDGTHNLTVFIGQAKEDGTISPANIDPFSFTINFNVDAATKPPSSATPSNVSSNSEPSPTIPVVIATSIASAAVIGFSGIVIYSKKGKHN
jgi:hypothetical protein